MCPLASRTCRCSHLIEKGEVMNDKDPFSAPPTALPRVCITAHYRRTEKPHLNLGSATRYLIKLFSHRQINLRLSWNDSQFKMTFWSQSCYFHSLKKVHHCSKSETFLQALLTRKIPFNLWHELSKCWELRNKLLEKTFHCLEHNKCNCIRGEGGKFSIFSIANQRQSFSIWKIPFFPFFRLEIFLLFSINFTRRNFPFSRGFPKRKNRYFKFYCLSCATPRWVGKGENLKRNFPARDFLVNISSNQKYFASNNKMRIFLSQQSDMQKKHINEKFPCMRNFSHIVAHSKDTSVFDELIFEKPTSSRVSTSCLLMFFQFPTSLRWKLSLHSSPKKMRSWCLIKFFNFLPLAVSLRVEL